MKNVMFPPFKNKFILKPNHADWHLLYEIERPGNKNSEWESQAPFVLVVGQIEETKLEHQVQSFDNTTTELARSSYCAKLCTNTKTASDSKNGIPEAITGTNTP